MKRKWLKVLIKLDKLLRMFFGLKSQSSMRPDTVKVRQSDICIESTECCRRMRHALSWEQYRRQELHKLSTEDRVKLGIALGKAVANDVVVTFDKPIIVEKK